MVAAVFVVSVTPNGSGLSWTEDERADGHSERLAGTPFETCRSRRGVRPLSRGRAINVMFVVAASQLGEILMVADVTALIFFGLGLILLSPNCWLNGRATAPATAPCSA